MQTLSLKSKSGCLVLLLLMIFNKGFGQLPQCSSIYIDQYSIPGVNSTGRIYTYNPSLPPSATNPSLNTIQKQGQLTLGLTVSEILGSGNPTLTFYTVTDDQYWYYDPATSAWVNTNHATGSLGNAYNIASGGGYIYNLSGSDGNVFVYDGTGDGTFLVNIPDFQEEGPYDLIADCAGNFYVLNVTAVNADPFLRKYDHTGALLKSWTINNPYGYFLGNGFGFTAGFGIIGSTIYVDNIDPAGVKTIISGTINNTSVDFGTTAPLVALPFTTDDYPGDFGSCAAAIPVIPQITITASATSVVIGTPVTFSSAVTDAGTTPQYQWFVNNVPVPGAIGSTYTYAPNPGDVVTCQLTSDLPCVSITTVISNPISVNVEGCPPPVLDYGKHVYCSDIGTIRPSFAPAGGTFSIIPAELNINNATGTVDLSNGNPGSYVVTYFIPATQYCPEVNIRDTFSIVLPPEVSITVQELTRPLCINEDIMLQATEVPGFAYDWLPKIDFPFGNNTPTVKARIVAPGSISVTLTNDAGCFASDSLTLNPVTCCTVMVPNVFSPNSDGLNDEFKIYSNTNQTINQISVYNRYGQRIFFSKDQNKGWDGRYNNGDAEPGVYYYYVSYVCSDGQHFVKKGDVSLVR